jgi:hypothetical protein
MYMTVISNIADMKYQQSVYMCVCVCACVCDDYKYVQYMQQIRQLS